MHDELRIHWTLHGIDARAVACEAAAAKLPAERKAVATRIAGERARLAAVTEEGARAQHDRRALERDAEVLLAEERRFQKQLEAVTDQKQYDAVQHEIAAVHGRRSDLETEALLRMEAEEAAAAKRPELEQALARAESEGAARLAAIETETAALATELAALAARRAEAAAALEPAARTRYERLRTGRAGRAVAAIEHDACGECARGLPPAGVQAARRRDQLLVCDGCGRLLMLPPDAGA